MSNNALQKQSWWDRRPTWQKWGIGIGGTVLVVGTVGAAAYAIATYGATVSIVAPTGERIAVAIGKAALERGTPV
jgi:hypothetical protein